MAATAFCLILTTGGCASAQSGPQLAAVFNSGVAAYDAHDYAKAFKIWSSIQDEDLAAMRNVAMMLRRGQGTAKNPKKAEEIYAVAAEAGLPTAQADLADMLLKGEVGPPNAKAALPLLQAASAQGHPLAQFSLGQLYETGVDGLLKSDLEEARTLYTEAAGRGMKEAEARLRAIGPPGSPAPAGQP